ncbi:MAG: magnesium transporter [Phormidium sp. BM_Day4_Bin.17]|nr:magnesium transporter [Phormidium sp. BM_Day4_Bin.17]UCJ10907.1 MAG: magnesium transporter [Phormidium sp. PBR-2020]
MSPNALQDILQEPSFGSAKETVNNLPVIELAHCLSEIDYRKRVLAFRLLEKERAIEVFEHLHPDQQADLVQDMENPEAIQLLAAMDPDDRVQLIEELPAKITKRLIAGLDAEARQSVNTLLNYPERSAGRIMSPRYIAVRSHATAEEALDIVRSSPLRDDESGMVFIIDGQRFYRGAVRLVSLVRADPSSLMESLLPEMNPAVGAKDGELKAAQLLKDEDVPAVAVVDSEGRMVGAITFDDVIDLIEEEAQEAALSQAGVGDLISRDKVWSQRLVKGPAWYAIRLRILFLVVTLIGGFLVGGVIERFEDVLESVVVAAVFIPLVMDMGGNVGTQSTTVFARGLAWNQIDTKNFLPYLLREVRIGAMMGLILGAAAGFIAYLWQGAPNDEPMIGVVVGISLWCVITLGAILGSSLPWVMLKLGFDHAPGADPFITTIKDFVGLWIYFSLVAWLIGVAA